MKLTEKHSRPAYKKVSVILENIHKVKENVENYYFFNNMNPFHSFYISANIVASVFATFEHIELISVIDVRFIFNILSKFFSTFNVYFNVVHYTN